MVAPVPGVPENDGIPDGDAAADTTGVVFNVPQEEEGRSSEPGKVKARGCADGRPQRAYADKSESSSPTVATESIVLTCAIHAMENRAVAVIDIPGAFMQANVD